MNKALCEIAGREALVARSGAVSGQRKEQRQISKIRDVARLAAVLVGFSCTHRNTLAVQGIWCMNGAFYEIAGHEALVVRSGAVPGQRKEQRQNRVAPPCSAQSRREMYVAARPQYLELWCVSALGL